MKNKWVVEYWDHDADILKRLGFKNHEDAITHKHKIMKKFNSTNVKVILK